MMWLASALFIMRPAGVNIIPVRHAFLRSADRHHKLCLARVSPSLFMAKVTNNKMFFVITLDLMSWLH